MSLATEDAPTANAVEAPVSGRLRAESLSESVAILLVLLVAQRLVGFVRSVLFCRWLSPEQLGAWDMAFGFLMFAAPLAVLGLPGSFGRYVEYYRQRGQLKTYLRRTTVATLALGLVAVGVMLAAPAWIAEIVFGDAAWQNLMPPLTAALAAAVVYNLLTSLFIALRRNRVLSLMQFLASIVFAALGLGLIWHTPDARHVIAAFAGSYVVSTVVALIWLKALWKVLPACDSTLPQRSMWTRLMPFALGLWTTNWLSSMFEIADRFLLIQYSGIKSEAALDLVGQYHSARLVPMLMVSMAELLAAIITPHLSSDWEAGRRRRVGHRLGFMLKLFALAATAGSATFLIVAPALFQFAFANKYASGEAVLPCTLLYCVWTSLAAIGFNYLWCAERSRLVTTTLGLGLSLNIVLNLLLLPAWGLWGAVISTTIA
ncbi:MAG TPA: lipopolysaccharide biosynthesis protein, partial [Pirellulales bacterium]|nr:lipopolysaccharide biosynthesis protein [Pirellulales bacterium]